INVCIDRALRIYTFIFEAGEQGPIFLQDDVCGDVIKPWAKSLQRMDRFFLAKSYWQHMFSFKSEVRDPFFWVVRRVLAAFPGCVAD
ncbi:hypothetical protein, partial [Escherichia coli]|uniref:hypothetical protein n=1 Tax=Escherichia coli TaxID=562 RepID=UPI000CB33EAD